MYSCFETHQIYIVFAIRANIHIRVSLNISSGHWVHFMEGTAEHYSILRQMLGPEGPIQNPFVYCRKCTQI